MYILDVLSDLLKFWRQWCAYRESFRIKRGSKCPSVSRRGPRVDTASDPDRKRVTRPRVPPVNCESVSTTHTTRRSVDSFCRAQPPHWRLGTAWTSRQSARRGFTAGLSSVSSGWLSPRYRCQQSRSGPPRIAPQYASAGVAQHDRRRVTRRTRPARRPRSPAR